VIDFITTTKMTDRSVVASCLLASRFDLVGMSSVVPGASKRPTKALEVAAAVAQEPTYAFASAANGAGDTKKRTQHNPKWAFRGLEPWRDPA
jgi:hypothetical protein